MVSVAALVVLSAAFAIGFAYRASMIGATFGAREWLRTGSRFSSAYYQQNFQRLQGQGAALARLPQLSAAFQRGGNRVFPELLGSVGRLRPGSFWLAVSTNGALLATNDQGCVEGAQQVLQRAPLDLERGTFFLCDTSPAMAVVVPVGGDTRVGWILFGERLGDSFVDDMARLSNCEVVLWGPRGYIAGTFRNQAGQRLEPVFDAHAATLLTGAAGYFGRHELTVPHYQGYGPPDRLVEAGSSRIDTFMFIDALDPSARELPVRLVFSIPAEVMTTGVRISTLIVVVLAALSLVLFMVLSVWLFGRFARPLASLAHGFERVAAGELDARVSAERNDEVGEVVEAFNTMVARLKEGQQRLVQSAKMAAVGQLAAGMAHELNNPLGVILGFAQAIDRRLPEGDPGKFPTQSIIREALRCKELVQHLLTFSRSGLVAVEPVDLNALVTQTLPLLEPRAKEQGVGLEVRLAPESPVLEGSKTQLQQLLMNLGANALDAMPRGGTLTVRTAAVGPGGARLEVADTGVGIPEEIRGRIFEPFFTTKPVGEGSGLGLSLVYEIVSRHKGDIEVRSRAGEGTVMVVSIPGKGSALEATA